MAFLAVIKSINPALVDLRERLSREPRENIQLAFMIAHHSLDIPPLLEPEGKSLLNSNSKHLILVCFSYTNTFCILTYTV